MKKFAGDIIILHMCTKKHTHMMYGSWDMECDRQKFLSLWTVFCPFNPLWTEKTKILIKWKKIPRDTIILHMCTKNYDQMMYSFWDVVGDRCNCYFLFLATFALLPPNSPKNQNFWKIKGPGYMIILHVCTKSYNQMMYSSWDMMHDRCNCFSFWAIFLPFYSPNSRKVQNFKKMKKMPGDIISHMCTKNYDQMMHIYWDMVHDEWMDGWRDRQRDGWKKWYIELSAPAKKISIPLQNHY